MFAAVDDVAMTMTLNPTWSDIAIRLLLAMVAGAVIGLDREAGGHSAGLRTTIIVSLAAAVAMIQANILFSVPGKTYDLFATMDPMRLPLGILTGVGFIGAGAIMKRENLVAGVTTAATLWVMTVIGLCFGAGQLLLGCIATVLIIFTLAILKGLDFLIKREQRGRLIITSDLGAASPPDIDTMIRDSGYRAQFVRQCRDPGTGRFATEYEIVWKEHTATRLPVELLELVEQRYQLQSFEVTKEANP